MAIKNAGVLGYQRRSLQLGEIRMGTSVEIPGKKGRQPKRLNTFRFTVPAEAMATAVAALFGGHVAPWAVKRGYWEVITEVDAIEVYVPVRGEAVDSFMEMWDGPVRRRHCDGETELLSGEPCQCPLNKDERDRQAKLRPPQACKPLTRIRVSIPQLPGLGGIFRLNTGSENALVETADASEVMQIARDDGVYLPAVLRIEWRRRAADGSPYQVPVLQIGASLAELAAHALPGGGTTGLLTQLRASGPQPKAIEADPAADGQEPASAPVPVTDEVRAVAQRIADDAVTATSEQGVRRLITEARQAQVMAVQVCIGNDWVPLETVLHDAWDVATGANQ